MDADGHDVSPEETSAGPVATPPADAPPLHPAAPVVRWIARGLITLWGGFWVWFSVASGIYEWQESGELMQFLMHQVLTLVIIALVIVMWRWELVGGICFLALLGAFFVFFNHGPGDPGFPLIYLILYAPVLITGILLFASWYLHRRVRGSKAKGPG